jgi:hypothetical protein
MLLLHKLIDNYVTNYIHRSTRTINFINLFPHTCNCPGRARVIDDELNLPCHRFAFVEKNSLGKSIRVIFIIGFILAYTSLILITYTHGLDRGYLYEIIVISINWLVLLINSKLIGREFQTAFKELASCQFFYNSGALLIFIKTSFRYIPS